MSSSCSSVDLGIGPDFDDLLIDSLLNDIELFSEHTNRLRRSLDPTSYVPESESKCVQVHAALSMVSQSVRDLLIRYPVFKTSQVLIPASQLVHSIKGLNFDGSFVDLTRTLQCIEKLEAAVGNTLRHSLNVRDLTESSPTKYNTVTFGRKLNKQATLGAPINSNGSAQPEPISNGTATVTGASDLAHAIGVGKKTGRAPLFRRHSAFQPPQPAPECEMDALLMESAGPEAMQLAFGRSKAWSKYCQIVIGFYNQRLRLENEHAQKLQKLAESTKNTLTVEFKNNTCLPLFDHFVELLEVTEEYGSKAESTFKSMNEKVVKNLQQRHDDHESLRRSLKQDYAKQEKALNTCLSDLKKAQRNMESSQSSYFKARDTTSRSQHAIQNAGVLGPDHHRKMKEIEKKRKNEEDAFQKKSEAESQVRQLKMRKEIMTQSLNDLKIQNIKELCSAIILCDRTTQVTASQFSEAFSNFWLPFPAKYQELADAARYYRPGAEFMSFLHNLPGRSISNSSLLRQDGTSAATPSEDEHVATTSTGGRSSTASSSSRARRNALNEAEHLDFITETQQHRKPKKSMGRLFDQGSTTDYSEPTKSHKLVRTRQVIKCYQCDRVSLLSETVKCTTCGICWHKKCLAGNTVVCGPNAKPLAESTRRVSIFGVPLKNHLELQKRQVPQILERCIDEIQKRGMKARGIYRTCGVKSKVEQICQMFEQSDGKSEILLDEVHPMNIASVIKLYFRKLPEPLLGFELYKEFIDFDVAMEQAQIITRLQDLFVTKLPEQNYETLKFLMLHLKRVTWFQTSNLMTASNLAAVIAPSLIWGPIHGISSTPISSTSSHSGSFINDAHQQSRVIEIIINYAFEIFGVECKQDWKEFFEKYSNLKEPEQQLENVDQTDFTREGLGIGEDDDELDEEFDGEDEIEQTGCSSSNVSQLPPTPDMLRNSEYNFDGSVDELNSSRSSKQYLPAIRTVSAGNPPSQLSVHSHDGLSKHRSFTTSILVSPQNDRKIFLPQQHSVDSRTRELAEKQQETGNTTNKVVRSGEVTIDMKQDQFFIPSPESNGSSQPSTIKNSSGSNGTDGDQVCLNGLGLFLGTDVSYV
uniref:Uncharacterized protein n=1 Tax=Panagrolaimus sp. JU765 TaxID=591449 RepID=A0AC34QM43_9BILA